MADNFQNLTDLAKINDKNTNDYGISDLLDDAPLLKVLAADVASNGLTHKYLKETGAPSVGFRAINVGRENSKSADTVVSVDLKLLDASFAVDKALADGYRGGPEVFLAREARRHLKAAFAAAESQIINGTSADGFDGMSDALLLANAMTVNAGGTTAATGSSVYAVRTSDSGTDVQAILGQEGQIAIADPVVQAIEDVTNGGRYAGYFSTIQAWMTLQVGGVFSLGRVANVTADSGKTLDDDKLAELLSRFPASRPPSYFVLNRRSLKQLQQSRTATNATGAPAPFPTEAFGIPIIVTDAISSTETLLS